MKMLATSRPTGDTSAQSHTWEVEDDDYDRALERVRTEVPAGSTLLYIRVER
ncbi:hypothetical protein [Nocardioides sp.]|uniref:hypothetical protein n=1 Tax=Nocardioides sp. TaxID=35761 RepID=UPI0032193FCE